MEVIGGLGLFTRPVLGERHLNSRHHCQRHERKSYCRAFREGKRYRALKLSRAVALVPPIKLRFGGWKALEVITRWNDGRRRHANCSSDNDRGNAEGFLEGFSKLSPDLPWDRGSIWTILATYFFLLHIPLSLGGLSFVAQVLNKKDLNPQTKAISLLLTQTIELIGAIFLVQSEAKLFNPSSKSFKFYFANVWVERGWLKASIAGIATIGLVAIITSPILEFIFKTKATENIMLEEVLSSSIIARCSCFVLYCFITPFLEEYVYRGFLLTSLTLYMKWPLAVIVSACIFSVAHFSVKGAVQIFFIGCVLGAAYTWSGNLTSSFIIHFVYNFAVLMTTILT